MKILCLSRAPLDFKGGIPSYCLNLYKDSIHEVLVFSYDIEKKINKVTKRRILNINETIYPSEFSFSTIAFSMRYFHAVIKESFNREIIHVQHPDPFSSLAIIFLKIINPRSKILVTWHAEIYKSYKLLAPLLFVLDYILFALTDKFIFFTPFHVTTSVLAKLSFVKRKIQIIEFGIDYPNINLDTLEKKRSANIEYKKSIDVLSIGRLVNYKGYENSIKAIKKTDRKVRYFIIGSGPLQKKLQELIFELELVERVFLLGNQNEEMKNKFLLNSDLFIFPSINQSEAFGIAQLEALSYGLPIINTNLNNGVNYLVPPNIAITCENSNCEELSKAINYVISSNKIYSEFSRKSFKHFRKFSKDKMQIKFDQLINKIKLN
tara:strand:+ start:138 stop:1271 length:1134 start_codon:yes stop_codon:yes gene_type:complete